MKRSLSFKQFGISVLLFSLSLRLLAIYLFPLADKTESRYGEIARLMLQTGDWITPQIEVGVPFWGKPPLSTWLSALSFKLFGISELAARLPSFLLGLAVLWLTWRLASQYRGRRQALRATLILALIPAFFISSGAIMTDPSLLLGTTLAMTAFGISTSDQPGGKIWGYLFFVGLAIGLLAKGPVAVVMVGIPTFLWTLWQKKWGWGWRQLPWLRGILLTSLLSLPWYLLAEYKSPGFLDYFIVGEHWKRFMVHGWKGDLYGSAHSRPKGSIWFFWLLAAAPWSFVILSALRSKVSRSLFADFWREKREQNAYLLLWTIAPMLFFSMSGNILWTYILPGLPAFAILLAGWFEYRLENSSADDEQPNPVARGFSVLSLGVTVLFIVALIGGIRGQVSDKSSQRELIAECQALGAGSRNELIYLFQEPYSAEFYSNGEARLVKNWTVITDLQMDGKRDYFVVRHIERLPADFRAKVEIISKHGRYTLLREKPLGVIH